MHARIVYLSIVALSIVRIAASIGFTQSVRAKGQLLCGTQPATEVQVKLEDYDHGPDPDDLLDSGYTDSEGRFDLSGDTSEFTTIDPRIRIYHDCNDKTGVVANPCQRLWKITIPDKYVSKGKTPKTTFELGTVNLEVELDDEDRDCIH